LGSVSSKHQRLESLFAVENGMEHGEVQSMPWMSVYKDDSEIAKREDAKWAAEGVPKVIKTPEDRLWCGAGSCNEKGYARHGVHWAKSMAGLIAKPDTPAGAEEARRNYHFWELWHMRKTGQQV